MKFQYLKLLIFLALSLGFVQSVDACAWNLNAPTDNVSFARDSKNNLIIKVKTTYLGQGRGDQYLEIVDDDGLASFIYTFKNISDSLPRGETVKVSQEQRAALNFAIKQLRRFKATSGDPKNYTSYSGVRVPELDRMIEMLQKDSLNANELFAEYKKLDYALANLHTPDKKLTVKIGYMIKYDPNSEYAFKHVRGFMTERELKQETPNSMFDLPTPSDPDYMTKSVFGGGCKETSVKINYSGAEGPSVQKQKVEEDEYLPSFSTRGIK